MAKPWLHIVGLGEGGGADLAAPARAALQQAEFVFGGARHLQLVAGLVGPGRAGEAQLCPWPVPFDIAPVLAQAGRAVVALVSGDPFWFGAGSVLAAALRPGEWVSHPNLSSFALAANHLAWPIEGLRCHGLHAAPFARLRADLHQGARLLVTLRDGAALGELAAYLVQLGFGGSQIWGLSRLGGPHQAVVSFRADTPPPPDLAPEAPVMAAIQAQGQGLPRGFGLDEGLFQSDGQITKAPARAVTLAALAPRAGEMLWDIGAGSGSISVEWCLAGGLAQAVETRADRLAHIAGNARTFGVDHRLAPVLGRAPQALTGLPPPDAVFVGGGGDGALYAALWPLMPPGCRLVANAVTLESEALLCQLQSQHGGSLLRLDLAQAVPLGRMTAWQAARPIVQWRAQR